MYIKLKSTHLSSNLKQKVVGFFFYFKYARIMSTLYVYNYATELLVSIIQTYRPIDRDYRIVYYRARLNEILLLVLCFVTLA